MLHEWIEYARPEIWSGLVMAAVYVAATARR
jgi:hypothetical protein